MQIMLIVAVYLLVGLIWWLATFLECLIEEAAREK